MGATGANGTSVRILGTVESIDDLPDDAELGDGYLVGGVLYVFTGPPDGWTSAGQIQGPAGPTGPTGTFDPGGTLFYITDGTENDPVVYGGEMRFESDSLNIATNRDPAMVRIDDRTQRYSVNLSNSASVIDIPFGNLHYRARGGSDLELSIYSDAQILVDIRRFGQYTDVFGVGQIDSGQWNNYTLSGILVVDSQIYNDTNEKNTFWIRQRDPVTLLWSLHEIGLFSSQNGARTSIWVTEIESGVQYNAP